MKLKSHFTQTILKDNDSIHSSRLTNSIWGEMNISLSFTTSYCPEVTSVVLIFRILKSKLASSESREDINFVTVKGIKRLRIDYEDCRTGDEEGHELIHSIILFTSIKIWKYKNFIKKFSHNRNRT